MNDRTQDLIKECTHGETFDKEEFVKFLVLECSSVILNCGYKISRAMPKTNAKNYTTVAQQVGMVNAAMEYADKIQEHFGVKK